MRRIKKRNSPILTKKQRDILILGAKNRYSKHLSNAEIAQQLGVSVGSVKVAIHHACIKLKAHNRNGAIVAALKRGEIYLSELCSLDEIAERFSPLGPNVFRRIAYLVRQGMWNDHPIGEELIVIKDRRQDAMLTQAEQDVVILAGYGLTNREIADILYISISAVSTFIYRACTKLGTRKRADAVSSALKQGEISTLDIFSPEDLMRMFAPLGVESIEKIAQLIEQKLGKELIITNC